MIALALAAALASLPAPPPVLSIPRGTVPAAVTPDPRPPLAPEKP